MRPILPAVGPAHRAIVQPVAALQLPRSCKSALLSRPVQRPLACKTRGVYCWPKNLGGSQIECRLPSGAAHAGSCLICGMRQMQLQQASQNRHMRDMRIRAHSYSRHRPNRQPLHTISSVHCLFSSNFIVDFQWKTLRRETPSPRPCHLHVLSIGRRHRSPLCR